MSLEQVKSELLERGLVDNRKIVVFANAKNLPSGAYGLCILAVSSNTLTVFDTDFSQRIGDILYVIPLDQIKDIKASDFIFRRYLQFTYNDHRFHFADFGDARNFISAVISETAFK